MPLVDYAVSFLTVIFGITLADLFLVRRTVRRAVGGLKQIPEVKQMMGVIRPHLNGLTELVNTPEFEKVVADLILTIRKLPALVEKADRVLSIFDLAPPQADSGEKPK